MEFYHFALCHFCKHRCKELKKCSSCKTVYYCSALHQKNDWKNHKELCKVITKSSELIANDYARTKTPESVNKHKSLLRIIWSNELNRSLFSFEEQMWMFPKICSVCYSNATTLSCDQCHSVAYCSESHLIAHKEEHHKNCIDFQLNLCILRRYRPKPQLKPTHFHLSLEKDIEKTLNLLDFKKGKDFSDDHFNFIALSETYSPIFNIIYALEKSKQLQNNQLTSNHLVIHIVGSDFFEKSIDWETTFQFFANYITNILTIDIYCIGPSVNDSDEDLDFKVKNQQGAHVSLHFSVADVLYHQIVDDLPRPNVVTVFNCGLHEFSECPEQDDWKLSIPYLIKYPNIPLLLTAYTKNELLQDLKRFGEEKIDFFIEPQRNPYSGLKPMRNWQMGDEPIYFQNGYIAIFTKTLNVTV